MIKQSQRGSTLLVALVMLVLLTLIAISAMSTTTASIQVVGNAQMREEAFAAGQRAIEAVISNANFKDIPPPPQNIDINLDGNPDYTVTFQPAPTCTSYRVVADSEKASLPSDCVGEFATCYWTTWDVTANVTDTATGANVVIHQGIRTVAGLNTAVNLCEV